MVTVHAQLIAKREELDGYIVYVFKNLDNVPFGRQYIMCVRWPNWEEPIIELNEIGYLTFKEVIAGVDSWWDGTKLVKYDYSNLVFIKFIIEPKQIKKDIII